MTQRGFGSIRKLPSGNYQCRYIGPDCRRHTAPKTFTRWGDADTWLSNERRYRDDLIATQRLDEWETPEERTRKAIEALMRQTQIPTLTMYAEKYLRDHPNSEKPIRPSTMRRYDSLLKLHILPELGYLQLPNITKSLVSSWRSSLPETRTTNQAYSLLHAVMAYAVAEEVIPTNPCAVRRGGKSSKKKGTDTFTTSQVAAIVDAMPDHLKMAVLIAAHCGLSSGEVRGLQRSDINADQSVIHVRRGVTKGLDGINVGDPKTEARKRNRDVPEPLRPLLKKHLNSHTQIGDKGLLFYQIGNGTPMSDTHLGKIFRKACVTAGVDGACSRAGVKNFTFHDLRAYALTKAGISGATIRELQDIAGHTTPTVAMRYQRIDKTHMEDVMRRMGEDIITPRDWAV